MNRTRKLMTTITTSLFLTNTLTGPMAPVQIYAQSASQEDEDWKKDPEVLNAANTVFKWLKGTPSSQAKIHEDVLKAFPGLKPSLVEKALKRLVYDGRISKTGDGSKNNPIRYYEYTRQHAG